MPYGLGRALVYSEAGSGNEAHSDDDHSDEEYATAHEIGAATGEYQAPKNMDRLLPAIRVTSLLALGARRMRAPCQLLV